MQTLQIQEITLRSAIRHNNTYLVTRSHSSNQHYSVLHTRRMESVLNNKLRIQMDTISYVSSIRSSYSTVRGAGDNVGAANPAAAAAVAA